MLYAQEIRDEWAELVSRQPKLFQCSFDVEGQFCNYISARFYTEKVAESTFFSSRVKNVCLCSVLGRQSMNTMCSWCGSKMTETFILFREEPKVNWNGVFFYYYFYFLIAVNCPQGTQVCWIPAVRSHLQVALYAVQLLGRFRELS